MIGTSSVFRLTSDSSDAGTLELPLIQIPVQGVTHKSIWDLEQQMVENYILIEKESYRGDAGLIVDDCVLCKFFRPWIIAIIHPGW